jgi:hypothetical protein
LKHDQCFVEEKMAQLCAKGPCMTAWWENMQARQLTELYRALRLYVNCFQPSKNLLSKEREGKKVRCVYDPAKTPLHRLLLSGVLPAETQQELLEVAQALDHILLFQQVALLLQAVFRCAASCSPFVSHTPPAPILVFSVADCAVGMLTRVGFFSGPEAGLQSLYREQ